MRLCKMTSKDIETQSLCQFKNENVAECCTKTNTLPVQLEKNNCLPETHLVDLIDHLSVCSMMEFKVPFLRHRKAIKDFIDWANGKDEAVVLALPKYIHFSDLLDEAKYVSPPKMQCLKPGLQKLC